MAMDAPPAAHLEVVQSQFRLGLAKTTLHRRPTEGHFQQPAQGDSLFPRHAVGHEIFHFPCEHVAGNDQAMPAPGQTMLAFAPKDAPFDLPDFRPLVRVLDAISLPSLISNHVWVSEQIPDFSHSPTPHLPPTLHSPS